MLIHYFLSKIGAAELNLEDTENEEEKYIKAKQHLQTFFNTNDTLSLYKTAAAKVC